MENDKSNKTFAEKYNLVGKGSPVRISQSKKDYVDAMIQKSKQIVQDGKLWAKNTKWRF